MTFLNLVRALFPYWSFFDQTAYTFKVFTKAPIESDWMPVLFETESKNNSILCNSTVNGLMAEFNVVEHFAKDVQEILKNSSTKTADCQHLTTFKLLCSIIRTRLESFPHKTFQFKILAVSAHDTVELFVSEPLNRATP